MSSETHRTRVSNVLVVGSGAAGLRAAIAVHTAGRDVVIVGKRLRKDAHTVLAAGGINAALGTVDPGDRWQQHFADTVIEGHYLANPRAVEILTREAPAAVLELAEWGCPFARLPDGRLESRCRGGDPSLCPRASRKPWSASAQGLSRRRSATPGQSHHFHGRRRLPDAGTSSRSQYSRGIASVDSWQGERAVERSLARMNR